MSKDLVVITGTSRGLGEEIARKLISTGNFRILGINRGQSDAPDLMVSQDYNELCFDLMNLTEIRKMAAEIYQSHGVPFGLINNSAVGNDGVLATMHESDISKILNVNLHAPILLSKYLGRLMLTEKRGRIINISSVVAGTGYSGLATYAATKSGLIGFTKSLAREYGKMGLEVNCVSPGFMETSMTDGLTEDKLASIRRRSPSKTLPSLNNIADYCLHLLNPMGTGINGANLVIDCGNSA